jgi:osmotically-inducible protein OsmY
MFSPDLLPFQAPSIVLSPVEIVERAETELRRNGYIALKNIACEFREGVLTLTGCLPTYYLKQLAGEAVSGAEGVERVENLIEVVSQSSRSASRS